MMRDDWTQDALYLTVAGASISLAFFVALKFAGHAKAQTPPPPKPAAAPAPAKPAATAAAPTTPPPATPPAAAAAASEGEDEAVTAPAAPGGEDKGNELSKLEGFLEPFIYDVVNRRDPFMPFAEFVPADNGPQGRALSPAQRYDLDQLRLVGVMWDIRDPKALFMDPESEIFTLGRDEGIGNRNGYIASIREGEVVVVEAIRKRGDVVYKTRVLHLER